MPAVAGDVALVPPLGAPVPAGSGRRPARAGRRALWHPSAAALGTAHPHMACDGGGWAEGQVRQVRGTTCTSSAAMYQMHAQHPLAMLQPGRRSPTSRPAGPGAPVGDDEQHGAAQRLVVDGAGQQAEAGGIKIVQVLCGGVHGDGGFERGSCEWPSQVVDFKALPLQRHMTGALHVKQPSRSCTHTPPEPVHAP